jgi:hypothetical protein
MAFEGACLEALARHPADAVLELERELPLDRLAGLHAHLCKLLAPLRAVAEEERSTFLGPDGDRLSFNVVFERLAKEPGSLWRELAEEALPGGTSLRVRRWLPADAAAFAAPTEAVRFCQEATFAPPPGPGKRPEVEVGCGVAWAGRSNSEASKMQMDAPPQAFLRVRLRPPAPNARPAMARFAGAVLDLASLGLAKLEPLGGRG